MRKISDLSKRCIELQHQLEYDTVEKHKRHKRIGIEHLERQLEKSTICDDRECMLVQKISTFEKKYNYRKLKKDEKKKNSSGGALGGGEEDGGEESKNSGGSSSSSSSSSRQSQRQWRNDRINKARAEYLECLIANCDEESVKMLVQKSF